MRKNNTNHARMGSESAEQQALFQWANYSLGKYPALEWMYHVPNEGKRSEVTGRRLKAEGLKPGVPDVCLPVPSCNFHGLYIELKVGKNKPKDEQIHWLNGLADQGYAVAVCYGWEEAQGVIVNYLEGRLNSNND